MESFFWYQLVRFLGVFPTQNFQPGLALRQIGSSGLSFSVANFTRAKRPWRLSALPEAARKRWQPGISGEKTMLRLVEYQRYTLQGTNISPKNGILKMIFLFPRWDMLIPWRVSHFFTGLVDASNFSFFTRNLAHFNRCRCICIILVSIHSANFSCCDMAQLWYCWWFRNSKANHQLDL